MRIVIDQSRCQGLGEWMNRVPPFRVADLSQVQMRASGVFGLEHLRLVWDAEGRASR